MSNSPVPTPSDLLRRYEELKSYVALSAEDVELAVNAWPLIEPTVPALVNDFYQEILRHAEPRQILSGPEQVERLKSTLRNWIADLFAGLYDESFVVRRWHVGYRHVQIGLQPIWVSAAMARLREQTLQTLYSQWSQSTASYRSTASAIARLMDLDLAMIQDAYNAESVAQRLNRERDFAEGVIQTAQAVVMVVDSQGIILRGNAFLTALLGWSTDPSDDNTHCLFDLVAPSDCHALQEFILHAASGNAPSPLDTELHPHGGPPRRVRWLARQFMSIPGIAEPLSASASPSDPLVLCVGQDITDLTEAQRQLVRQERLAAIGQTMTGLAHESRNAFQRSQAALETLSLELEDRPVAVQLIERIQRAHDHLLHLYEEVLQFARPVRLELHHIHVEQLVHQTWDHLLTLSAAKNLRVAIQGTAPPISADPFAVEQILRNVLENAIHASDPGALVEITVDPTWIGQLAAIRIVIRDFGKGIPDAYLERIFEPFFTTRSRGTGLGLPIARRLAEGHGGSLELHRADPGTVAEITLPLTALPDPEVHGPNEDPRRTAPRE
jgi:signal transduction histidine kinase